jgi:hypothetical protein
MSWVELVKWWVTESVSESVKEMLMFSFCELLLQKARSWGRGQLGNTKEGKSPPLKAATEQRLLYRCCFRCRCLATGLHVTILIITKRPSVNLSIHLPVLFSFSQKVLHKTENWWIYYQGQFLTLLLCAWFRVKVNFFSNPFLIHEQITETCDNRCITFMPFTVSMVFVGR